MNATAYTSFVEPVIDGHIVQCEARYSERSYSAAFELDQYGIVRSVVFAPGTGQLPQGEKSLLRTVKSLSLTGRYSLREIAAVSDITNDSLAGRLLADAIDALRRAGRLAA